MPANTPNYSIPYPLITDFVKDGATDMEAIAERVDDVLFASVANRNLLYNGAMQVAQRSTSAVTGITTGGFYTVDRWKLFLGTAGTWTQTPDTDVPTGQGFRRSLRMTCTTADPTPAAGDFFGVHQLLEGQDLQAIRKGTVNACELTISFWVKSNKTGTYIFELVDQTNGRAISRTYTINALNTWEYKTITIPADTTGQFANDNSLGLEVNWWLTAGSTWNSGSLQTSWGATTNNRRAFGQTNLADAINNSWQITGVQLNVGATATPFQFKSYEQELRECLRYYYRVTSIGATGTIARLAPLGFQLTTTLGIFPTIFPVQMRSAPTISGTGAEVSDDVSFSTVIFTLAITSANGITASTNATFGAVGAQFRPIIIRAASNNTAYVDYSAEL